MSLKLNETTAEAIVSTSSSGLPKWKQSPVDLNKLYTWTKAFPPLRLHGHWHKGGSARMTNTGQTVKIEFSDGASPGIIGGSLNNDDRYEFSDVQFRWGPNNCRGAEHSIDNLWFSMEAQAIHWNTRYESIEKCYEQPDGIAILSYLFQVVGCSETPDNPNLADITDNLPKIKQAGTSTLIPSDCLCWMSEACSANGYYTYEGSLTTPPYDECVTWIVIPRPIKISARQIDAFRGLNGDEFGRMLRSYRSQHALNRRTIFYAIDKAFTARNQNSSCLTVSRSFFVIKHRALAINIILKDIVTVDIVGLMKKGSSPINLDDRHVKFKKFAPLVLNGHWLKDGEAYLSNNGEYPVIQLSGNRIPSTVTGGPLLNDVYEFINTHFHWGKDNCNGSEHQINGTWFSMEAHAVHWNRKYQTFDECLKHKDGLAVLTYFFLVTEKHYDENNAQMEKITDHLKYVIEADTEIKIPANSLCWMRDATYCPKYYTYSGTYNKGSTPECATWIIFPLIIPISSCQIEEFRKLRNHDGTEIIENCKKIQTPNGRRVFLVTNSH